MCTTATLARRGPDTDDPPGSELGVRGPWDAVPSTTTTIPAAGSAVVHLAVVLVGIVLVELKIRPTLAALVVRRHDATTCLVDASLAVRRWW